MNVFEIVMNEVKKAFKKGEVPIGCAIVKDNRIISKTHNTKQKKHSCINHAEILAIIKAEKKLKDWRLNDCELYVSLEPCNMCKEVIRQARIKKVYYLEKSKFNNEDKKNIEYVQINDSNLKNDYSILLKTFFKDKR